MSSGRSRRPCCAGWTRAAETVGARRAAVTGLGIVSALGSGVEEFWSGLVEGRSGVAQILSFDVSGWRTSRGAEVKDFSPRETGAYLRQAAAQALEDARLSASAVAGPRTAVFIGTTFGECLGLNRVMDEVIAGRLPEAGLEEAARPLLPASLSAGLARHLRALGPQLTLTTACAAGNTALAAAQGAIEDGRADFALAGGVDLFSPAIFAGFNRLLAVAPERCAPFSAGRLGLIPGEGCAVLLLEDFEAARRRGARVYATLAGYGLGCDARHATAPDAEGIARAIGDCLQDAGLRPQDVGYVNAHGTGTPANDKAEAAAIGAVWPQAASRPPVSSIKGALGHAMGAASALEAAACCLALARGVLPPTINHVAGDPDCALDCVPRARQARPRYALSNAFAFGGGNCVTAFAAPEPAAAPAPRACAGVVVTAAVAVGPARDPEQEARAALPERDLGLLDAPIAYALSAARLALEQAHLAGGERTGAVLESSGELAAQWRFYRDLATGGPSAVEPAQFPNNLANAAVSRVCIIFGLKLAAISLAGAYPSGEGAAAFAWRLLRRRGSGAMLAGGVEAGACLLVLETEQDARSRGARILAEFEVIEESFAPEGAGDSSPCGCLAKAVRKVEEGGRPLDYAARSRFGGIVRLRLKPPTSS